MVFKDWARRVNFTTYFSLIATAVPVLLVAGLMNPVMLREYSKTPSRAKKAKRYIALSLAATAVSITLASLGDVDPMPTWLTITFICFSLVTGAALGYSIIVIYFLAEYALDENPHPDRFEFEERELERRQAELRAKRELHTRDDSNNSSQSS
ncbi:hypothetical protein CRD13_03470 [Corynebacterium sp. LK26]|nr:hypothetical protein [Corynebacterium sp. LK26]